MKTITVHFEFEDAALWAKFELAYGVDNADCPTDRGNLSSSEIVDVRVQDVIEARMIAVSGKWFPIAVEDCHGDLKSDLQELVDAELDRFVLMIQEQQEKEAAAYAA